jgi:vitamin B12 transporter
MKAQVFFYQVSGLSVLMIGGTIVSFVAQVAAQTVPAQTVSQASTEISRLSQVDRPTTRAQSLQPVGQPGASDRRHLVQTPAPMPVAPDPEETEIVVEGDKLPTSSTPVYVITQPEIQKQGATSVADVLRALPGFAINDSGRGADIHTGSYYRGASTNQSIFLLNGRPINNNINTYHGATDLNSIPVGAIDRVELSSGSSATLYGSQAVGGVVNIITKPGQGTPQFNGQVQFGSYGERVYGGNFSGSTGPLSFSLGYDRRQADNDYRVPRGAANRDANGRLFNADVETQNFYGNFAVAIDPRNTLSLDTSQITSRKGLIYFGFPLQRDRLDHDAFNIGLNWTAKLGSGNNSTLRTTLAFNKDYFSTYGPSGRFNRQGDLDARVVSGRVEHTWQTSPTNTLRWGFDLKNSHLTGDVISDIPTRIRFNGTQERDQFQAALFALNTFSLGKTVQAELGLRQNFNSEFGSSLNPSLGLSWAAAPKLSFRGSWVSVRRVPGQDQLYVYDTVHNWLPNPNLEPERGSSWTAGVDLRLTQNLTGQLTYFGSHLNDRLGIIAGRWENIGLVDTNGLEASLRWNLSPQWSTFFTYTYTDAKIQSGAEKGLQLSMVPYSVAQWGIQYANRGWQANLYTNYHSGARRAFYLLPGDTNRDFSPSWVSLNLGARIPLSGTFGLTLFLENLTGKTYERANRIYQPGLTFRLGITSKL